MTDIRAILATFNRHSSEITSRISALRMSEDGAVEEYKELIADRAMLYAEAKALGFRRLFDGSFALNKAQRDATA